MNLDSSFIVEGESMPRLEQTYPTAIMMNSITICWNTVEKDCSMLYPLYQYRNHVKQGMDYGIHMNAPVL